MAKSDNSLSTRLARNVFCNKNAHKAKSIRIQTFERLGAAWPTLCESSKYEQTFVWVTMHISLGGEC